jgi:hypothetical protein
VLQRHCLETELTSVDVFINTLNTPVRNYKGCDCLRNVRNKFHLDQDDFINQPSHVTQKNGNYQDICMVLLCNKLEYIISACDQFRTLMFDTCEPTFAR